MKNISGILNIILLIAVGVLYFLFFKKNNTAAKSPAVASGVANVSSGKLAYFDMDSVENRYTYIKNMRDQLKSKEQGINGEMMGLKKKYMDRIQQLQAKAQTMSQQEGEAAQAEINQMQQKIQAREGELTQSIQGDQLKMMQDINKKIEEYLKVFNKDNKYSFIFSHQPGDFIYYKDSLSNITTEVINGLNAQAAAAVKK
jgi:outer membrane protein